MKRAAGYEGYARVTGADGADEAGDAAGGRNEAASEAVRPGTQVHSIMTDPTSQRQYKLIRCRINGVERETMVDARASLTDMLRNDYSLTSVKKGCEVGECGACNVIIDGECYNSCIYLAAWADGKDILTLEGLMGPNGELSDIQQAFIDEALFSAVSVRRA